jgi:hypothetical protein
MLEKGTAGYNTDWNNILAQHRRRVDDRRQGRPAARDPRRLGRLGFRAGYNIAYQRGGMSDWTGTYGNNPGVAIDATRNLANGNLGTPPVLCGAPISGRLRST